MVTRQRAAEHGVQRQRKAIYNLIVTKKLLLIAVYFCPGLQLIILKNFNQYQ